MKERELFRLYCFKFIEQIFEENDELQGCKNLFIVRSLVDDGYIGVPNGIKFFIEHGIVPQKIKPSDLNCSIGFSEKENKWYGWRHRAVQGFTIGSKLEEGDCGYISGKGSWEAESINDAMQMAIDFAESGT